MYRALTGAVAVMTLAAAVAVAEEPAAPSTAAPATAAETPAAAKPAVAKTAAGPQVAVLETALGNIVIRFFPEDAPKTVANFKKLVKEKFYDGTYFHRVIQRFMIQGGDPNTKNADPNDDGMGGPGYTVPGEIRRKHLRGSVATARQGDQVNPQRASSGSQFFIDVLAQPSLDQGGYTVFGEVISGMDVVDKIVAFAADPATPRGAAGPNPGKKALIKRAYLDSMSKWEKPAEPAATPAKP